MTPAGRGKIIRFPSPPGVETALQVRADLLLVAGPVWRRLLLPGGATFWDLHVALQDAFGWEDRHLHQFTVDAPAGGTLRFGIPDDSGFQGAEDVLAGWDHRVAGHLHQDAPAALYQYDFTAERQVAVELEGRPRTGDEILPCCLDGVGLAPGEDGDPAAGNVFVAEAVRFHNPREHWLGKFGRG